VSSHAAAHPVRRAPARQHRGKTVAHRAASVKPTNAAPSADALSDARQAYGRGSARLLAGDLTGAIAAYREAVRLAPSDPSGYRGLGLAEAQKGETAVAIRCLRRYLKLAPAAPDSTLISRRIDLLAHATPQK
jgi:Flp pilus assembly protein TadD